VPVELVLLGVALCWPCWSCRSSSRSVASSRYECAEERRGKYQPEIRGACTLCARVPRGATGVTRLLVDRAGTGGHHAADGLAHSIATVLVVARWSCVSLLQREVRARTHAERRERGVFSAGNFC